MRCWILLRRKTEDKNEGGVMWDTTKPEEKDMVVAMLEDVLQCVGADDEFLVDTMFVDENCQPVE